MEEIRFAREQVRTMAAQMDESAEILGELPDATLALFLTYQVLTVLVDALLA